MIDNMYTSYGGFLFLVGTFLLVIGGPEWSKVCAYLFQGAGVIILGLAAKDYINDKDDNPDKDEK